MLAGREYSTLIHLASINTKTPSALTLLDAKPRVNVKPPTNPNLFGFFGFYLTMPKRFAILALLDGGKMNCKSCGAETKRFGKDRKGNQRFRCLTCKRVSVDQPERLLGDMIIAEDKAIDVLHHLVRGCSIRATA